MGGRNLPVVKVGLRLFLITFHSSPLRFNRVLDCSGCIYIEIRASPRKVHKMKFHHTHLLDAVEHDPVREVVKTLDADVLDDFRIID